MNLIKEVKITTVRECLNTAGQAEQIMRTPGNIYELWQSCIRTSEWYDVEKECFVVVLLDKKYRVKGYNLVSLGLLDTCLVHPREVFRPAVVSAAAAIVVMHNHPSGDVTPSAEDIRITRQLIEAGKILDIEVLDHVIVSEDAERHTLSLRETGLVKFTD